MMFAGCSSRSFGADFGADPSLKTAWRAETATSTIGPEPLVFVNLQHILSGGLTDAGDSMGNHSCKRSKVFDDAGRFTL